MKVPAKIKYKSIFISDTHLGTRGCKSTLLDNFLSFHDCENLYLIGDIIDGWALHRRWYFPQTHVNVIHHILKKAKEGTKVYWAIGNHDEFVRPFIKHSLNFGNVHIDNQFVYTGINGKKYLVIHGDLFDHFMKLGWLSHLGDWAYEILLIINDKFNWFRNLLGKDYWSLSLFLKHKVKEAVQFINKFEEHLRHYAEKRDYNGVICGHIHKPIIIEDTFTYMNTGDWVESCSALVEHLDGRWELIFWSKMNGKD